MTNKQIKLAKDTIRNLIDALEMDVENGNHVERLKAKKAAIETGEIVYAGLERL